MTYSQKYHQLQTRTAHDLRQRAYSDRIAERGLPAVLEPYRVPAQRRDAVRTVSPPSLPRALTRGHGHRWHDRPDVPTECANVQWAAENGESVEWARGMWWCDCPECVPAQRRTPVGE